MSAAQTNFSALALSQKHARDIDADTDDMADGRSYFFASNFQSHPEILMLLPQMAQGQCRTRKPTSIHSVWECRDTNIILRDMNQLRLRMHAHSVLMESGDIGAAHALEKSSNIIFDLSYVESLLSHAATIAEALDYFTSFELVLKAISRSRYDFDRARLSMMAMHLAALVHLDLAEAKIELERKEMREKKKSPAGKPASMTSPASSSKQPNIPAAPSSTPVSLHPAYWPARARCFYLNSIRPTIRELEVEVKTASKSTFAATSTDNEKFLAFLHKCDTLCQAGVEAAKLSLRFDQHEHDYYLQQCLTVLKDMMEQWPKLPIAENTTLSFARDNGEAMIVYSNKNRPGKLERQLSSTSIAAAPASVLSIIATPSKSTLAVPVGAVAAVLEPVMIDLADSSDDENMDDMDEAKVPSAAVARVAPIQPPSPARTITPAHPSMPVVSLTLELLHQEYLNFIRLPSPLSVQFPHLSLSSDHAGGQCNRYACPFHPPWHAFIDERWMPTEHVPSNQAVSIGTTPILALRAHVAPSGATPNMSPEASGRFQIQWTILLLCLHGWNPFNTDTLKTDFDRLNMEIQTSLARECAEKGVSKDAQEYLQLHPLAMKHVNEASFNWRLGYERYRSIYNLASPEQRKRFNWHEPISSTAIDERRKVHKREKQSKHKNKKRGSSNDHTPDALLSISSHVSPSKATNVPVLSTPPPAGRVPPTSRSTSQILSPVASIPATSVTSPAASTNGSFESEHKQAINPLTSTGTNERRASTSTASVIGGRADMMDFTMDESPSPDAAAARMENLHLIRSNRSVLPNSSSLTDSSIEDVAISKEMIVHGNDTSSDRAIAEVAAGLDLPPPPVAAASASSNRAIQLSSSSASPSPPRVLATTAKLASAPPSLPAVLKAVNGNPSMNSKVSIPDDDHAMEEEEKQPTTSAHVTSASRYSTTLPRTATTSRTTANKKRVRSPSPISDYSADDDDDDASMVDTDEVKSSREYNISPARPPKKSKPDAPTSSSSKSATDLMAEYFINGPPPATTLTMSALPLQPLQPPLNRPSLHGKVRPAAASNATPMHPSKVRRSWPNAPAGPSSAFDVGSSIASLKPSRRVVRPSDSVTKSKSSHPRARHPTEGEDSTHASTAEDSDNSSA